MATISAFTNFTIQDASSFEESVDLVLLPVAVGSNAPRELHYPGAALPVLTYYGNPDKTANFYTTPIGGRPITKAEMTLAGNKLAQWPGYVADRPVVETWSGSERTARLPELPFFAELLQYVLNPPASGYITWWPKDRTTTGYNIVIESLRVDGQDITLAYQALLNGAVAGEIVFTFYVVGEAS
jgi:hypothetical protein